MPYWQRAKDRAVEAGSTGPAQSASSVLPAGCRSTVVDSRGTAPRCPQLSTALPCRVSDRQSRDDQRAPGLQCSVMTSGLLFSRAAPPVPRLADSGVPPPYSRCIFFFLLFSEENPAKIESTSPGFAGQRTGTVLGRSLTAPHFPGHRAAGAKIRDPVKDRAGTRGEQIPRDWIGLVLRTGACLCPLRRLCAADACTPADCGG